MTLEKIIKKMHIKILFSLYGILSFVSLIFPLTMLSLGIWFFVSKINNSGLIWIVVGAVALLISLRRLKDFFPIIKYACSPKKFKALVNLKEDGHEIESYEEELIIADPIHKLSRKNPIIITEHFIMGYSQVNFFFMLKEDVMWVYEYNGNGLVFYDNHKSYGFTLFPTVDGNDKVIEVLKHEMPYIYFDTNFDFKKVMHDDFDQTVEEIKEERQKFIMNPDSYRETKEKMIKEKIEEESRRLEEEKNAQLDKILEGHEEEKIIDAQIVEEEKDNKEE